MREFSSLVQNEANSADDILDFLLYFDSAQHGDVVEEMRAQLYDYGLSLSHNLERGRKQREFIDSRPYIEAMIKLVKKLEPTPTASKSALDGLVRRLADLTTFRSETMEVTRQHFPWPFYVLLGLMPLVIIGGFVLIDNVQDGLHRSLLVTVTVVMIFLLGLVWDLDHPRRAIWNARRELEDYKRKLEDRIRPKPLDTLNDHPLQ